MTAAIHTLTGRLAAAILLMLTLLVPARAAGAETFETVLTGLTQAGSADEMRFDLQLTRTPRSRILILTRPDRIALDLFDTVSVEKDWRLDENGLVSRLRHGLVARDRYRMIFELKRPGVPKVEMTTVGDKAVLSLRIQASDAKAFRAAAAAQPAEVRAAEPRPGGETERRLRVVVDPGHGGVDTGAIGRHGTQEKDVNLAFALALRDVLAANPRVEVTLTRTDDTYIPLAERSEIARRLKADLFVSMHSDSIRYGDLRGASVYTLSEKASDSLARDLAESENSADRFVDPQWRDNQSGVFDILVELMRRETESLSEHFAAGLVQELGRHDIRLIRNPKRSAGFKVLTAPDVPSVLLEIGYLSNVDDEKLLTDESWRKDAANAIAGAIGGFLHAEPAETAQPPQGG